jgi:hypothetical protein
VELSPRGRPSNGPPISRQMPKKIPAEAGSSGVRIILCWLAWLSTGRRGVTRLVLAAALGFPKVHECAALKQNPRRSGEISDAQGPDRLQRCALSLAAPSGCARASRRAGPSQNLALRFIGVGTRQREMPVERLVAKVPPVIPAKTPAESTRRPGIQPRRSFLLIRINARRVVVRPRPPRDPKAL